MADRDHVAGRLVVHRRTRVITEYGIYLPSPKPEFPGHEIFIEYQLLEDLAFDTDIGAHSAGVLISGKEGPALKAAGYADSNTRGVWYGTQKLKDLMKEVDFPE